MTINLQTGGYTPPQPLPGARSADTQVVQKQKIEQPAELPPIPTGFGSADPTMELPVEQKRFEQVTRAAKQLVQNSYPVSDKSFTIFKDSSGQYVTRYTSLRDGRTTYIPEPKMLQMFEDSQQTRAPMIEIQA